MPADQRTRHLAELLLGWLNARYDAHFALTDGAGPAYEASDGPRRLGLYVAPLWEPDTAWDETLDAMEQRLQDIGRGAYILWVPPKATVPIDEPDATYFVTRVYAAAEGLQPGQRTEVTFPATIRLAKLREEGGYASVAGGLSRWWTRITENVSGTFSVDSNAVHRLTLDGAAREELWSMIGRLSNGIDVGQSGEFEIEEAWTLQRLPDPAVLSLSKDSSSITLTGAPPKVDPNDGILIRRMTRKQLMAANAAFDAVAVDLRASRTAGSAKPSLATAVALIGAYEYAEVETASGTLKAIDPGLYARIQVVSLLVDGEVKPVFAPATL
jgi:hypothetical protein